jgi:hypothetical protein
MNALVGTIKKRLKQHAWYNNEEEHCYFSTQALCISVCPHFRLFLERLQVCKFGKGTAVPLINKGSRHEGA